MASTRRLYSADLHLPGMPPGHFMALPVRSPAAAFQIVRYHPAFAPDVQQPVGSLAAALPRQRFLPGAPVHFAADRALRAGCEQGWASPRAGVRGRRHTMIPAAVPRAGPLVQKPCGARREVVETGWMDL